MTLHAALQSAIEALRPGTDSDHRERIIRDMTAMLKRELRWLDIYEAAVPERQAAAGRTQHRL